MNKYSGPKFVAYGSDKTAVDPHPIIDCGVPTGPTYDRCIHCGAILAWWNGPLQETFPGSGILSDHGETLAGQLRITSNECPACYKARHNGT